jgi:hypothetical protein
MCPVDEILEVVVPQVVGQIVDAVRCLVNELCQLRLVLLAQLAAHGGDGLSHLAQPNGSLVELRVQPRLGLVGDLGHRALSLLGNLASHLLRLVGHLP